MKQECLFEIKNNSLLLKSTNEEINFSSSEKIDFSLETSRKSVAWKNNSVIKVSVKMSTVRLGEGAYDENFLAELRLFLKKLEDACVWVVIVPESDGFLSDNFDAGVFIETVAHTSRRIKDCRCVVGIVVPQQFSEADTSTLTAALKKKHPHYIYFSGNDKVFFA